MRCAHLHPHRWWDLDPADRHAEHTCGLDAGTEDFILVVGGFDAIDAATGEVDQACGAVQLPMPILQRSAIPIHIPPRAAAPWWMPCEDDDRRAARCQVMGKRGPKEATPAGNHNLAKVCSPDHRTSHSRGC